ncbi:hypothetical protein E0Z10_g4310 [Xylaria hypoxylon]|uniref:Uncharacterized protein n=1 Tax=Xylaria hypoxylon TaxID=37992 RepID=A0A4Z0Z7G5_9PEZI|nr:hypothetical protein E0Z10_g4310 [Xylaria hypoxylon]
MRLAHNTTVSADDVNFRGAGSDYPDDASDHTLQASPQVAPLASLEAAPQIVSQATAQVAPQALPQAYHRVQRRLFRRLHRSLLPRMSYYAPNRIVSWERLADPNEVDHNNYQQLYGRESHPEPQVELQQALQEDPYPEHFLDPKPEQQHVFYQGPQQTFQNPPENQFGYWVANPTQYNANNGLQGFNYQTVDWLQYAIAWADASQLRQEMEAERQAGESHSHPHDPHRFDHLIHPNLADFNERDHMNQLLDVKTHEYQQLKLKYYAVRAELDRTQAVVSWYRDRHAQSDVSGRESHTHQPTSEHPSVDLAQSHEE